MFKMMIDKMFLKQKIKEKTIENFTIYKKTFEKMLNISHRKTFYLDSQLQKKRRLQRFV
jgi:hypothetical protein